VSKPNKFVDGLFLSENLKFCMAISFRSVVEQDSPEKDGPSKGFRFEFDSSVGCILRDYVSALVQNNIY
jgi:hypothetical protein